MREDGKKQTYLLKQGNEEKAGAKHSLYRHYGTNTGVITADDVLKIPQVLERGERIEKAKGGKKMAVYTMDVDGAKFTVYTRIGKDYETIDDFYSNKKVQNVTCFVTPMALTTLPKERTIPILNRAQR